MPKELPVVLAHHSGGFYPKSKNDVIGSHGDIRFSLDVHNISQEQFEEIRTSIVNLVINQISTINSSIEEEERVRQENIENSFMDDVDIENSSQINLIIAPGNNIADVEEDTDDGDDTEENDIETEYEKMFEDDGNEEETSN